MESTDLKLKEERKENQERQTKRTCHESLEKGMLFLLWRGGKCAFDTFSGENTLSLPLFFAGGGSNPLEIFGEERRLFILPTCEFKISNKEKGKEHGSIVISM